MKFLKLTLTLVAFVVLAVSAPAKVTGQDACTSNSYCNCPCNQLCYGPQNCSCEAQYCTTTQYCGSSIPLDQCLDPVRQPAPYPSYCADPQSRCITLTTNCVIRQDTYTCPYYVNPCINICGEAPSPTATPTPAPSCGNGVCNPGENCMTCWQDCGACPTAAPSPPLGCGDGSCSGGETCGTCSTDCGTCPPPPSCGNGICNPGENCSVCSADCGSCPASSCNPDLWSPWGSCSGSPATKSRTNGCGTTQTISCTGTIRARAAVVTAGDTSCAAVRSSTNGISGAVHQFTPGSASQPPPQTQSGASYVTFSNVVAGSYTISPTVPSDYVITTACWSRTLNSPTTGEGLSAYLSVPTDGETLTWDIGYTLGTPWVQAGGGNVYATGAVRSMIPSGTAPRVLVTNGAGGYPGVVTYGTNYDFDSDPVRKGESYVSSTDWLAQDSPAQRVNWYEYYYAKLGGLFTPEPFPDLGAVAKPASRPTPYYVVGDMTTSGDWVVGEGETIILIVNGNLTLGGQITITGSGFVAFIARGNITVSSSVGGLSTSSAPVIEGVYVTSPTGTFQTGTSTVAGKERLVAQGIFVAGSFLLQRDLDSVNANTTTAAELFLYNPRLLFTMPDSLRDVPITWEEVAP